MSLQGDRAFPGDLFKGRRVAVLGLGRNGMPAARNLAAMGADVSAWDDGDAARAAAAAAGVALVERHDAAGLDALVLSPGIAHRGAHAHPLARAAMAAGIPVLSDAEFLFHAVRASGSKARFVGITGTNGKSTTTVLVRHLLERAGIAAVAGGNLGPACLALPLLGDDGVYVLEMSSYMLERVPSLRFDAAVLLNLSPDHLDRHGDMAGYVAAKLAIFANQAEGDLALVGVDDPQTRAVIGRLARPPVTISGTDACADCNVIDSVLHLHGKPVVDLAVASSGTGALAGTHNAQNAAAAAAIASRLGVAIADIAAGLSTFPGLAHRQKRVATISGIDFVDDSKATNADATARALASVARCVWIAGGQAKSGGIEALAPWFGHVAEALLIGQDADMLAATLAQAGVPHRVVHTLERAVPDAFTAATRHGVRTVLLSPACASFDQFSGFEARGLRFSELAGKLARAPDDAIAEETAA